MPVHVTLFNHTIKYPKPTPALAKFIKRLEAMVADTKVPEDQFRAVLFGRDNPLLDHTLYPERGPITAATLKDPVYPVLMDLLAQKQAQEDRVNLEKLEAEYSMPVTEAAGLLGVHVNTLKKRIKTRQLRSWVKKARRGGQPEYYIKPEAVDGLRKEGFR